MTYIDLVERMKTADICVMPADAAGPMCFGELAKGCMSDGDIQRFTSYWVGYAQALLDHRIIDVKICNQFIGNMSLIACCKYLDWTKETK